VARPGSGRRLSSNRRGAFTTTPVLPPPSGPWHAHPDQVSSCTRIGSVRLAGVIHGGTNIREASIPAGARRRRCGAPHVVDLGDVARVSAGEDVPVAIIVVAGVLLVELRRRVALNGVPLVFAVPALTMSSPSGLSVGTNRNTVFSRMAWTPALLSSASVGQFDGGVVAPISVAWMEAGDQDRPCRAR